MEACSTGRVPCVRVLLKDQRVNLNEPDSLGHTPLRCAADSGYLDVIKWWIASGREMDLGEPEDGKTDAIGEAKREGQTEVVKLLRKFKKDETKTRDEVRMALEVTLFEAISNGEVSEMREILLKNPTQNVNFRMRPA